MTVRRNSLIPWVVHERRFDVAEVEWRGVVEAGIYQNMAIPF